MWENHGKNYQLAELKKQLEELRGYSDISFDQAAQQEYLRLEKQIDELEGKK